MVAGKNAARGSSLQREGPLLGSSERNRLAARLKAKREGNAGGWAPEEIAEMEEGDAQFISWEAELERLKALIGP